MNSWPRMSPGIMAGTYACSRCRSEPQIAVDVIFTIASRALMIFGSGTSSTWTVFGPFQHVAFIVISLFGLLARSPCGTARTVCLVSYQAADADCVIPAGTVAGGWAGLGPGMTLSSE